MIEGLRDCFREEFGEWLLNSNCSGVGPFKGEWGKESSRMRRGFDKIESDSLQAILDILIIHPEADYFWYTYKEHGSRLTYSLPSPKTQAVPGDALRVDKEKIKVFLRNIKINQILQ